MLDQGGLYFSILASMEDELEGAPPRLPRSATDDERRSAFASHQQARRSAFVNCWYMFRDESSAMWKLYGNQGVAIRTNYAMLVGSIDRREPHDPLNCHAEKRDGIVEYVDPRPTSRAANPWYCIDSVLRKRHWYQHEREFRLIHFDGFLGSGPLSLGGELNPPLKGKWASCSLDKMISAVTVAPNSPAYLEEVVREVCRRFELSQKVVRRSQIEERPPAQTAPRAGSAN